MVDPTGGGEVSSGDIFLAFAAGNQLATRDSAPNVGLQFMAASVLSELFWAAIEATEEAIVNALVAAETMVGRDGITAHELPKDRLRSLMELRPR